MLENIETIKTVSNVVLESFGDLRLVHTDRVKRSRIGQFLRPRKSWSVGKFSILLRKHMRFTQI